MRSHPLERRIRLHLLPHFGGKRLAAITTADVNAFILKRQKDVMVVGEGDEREERRYSNGEINRESAVAWLEKYGMYTKPRAEQRVRFIEQYRSYVINYNLGKDLVRAYIERKMGRDKTPARRWREFAALLSSPRLPSGLK